MSAGSDGARRFPIDKEGSNMQRPTADRVPERALLGWIARHGVATVEDLSLRFSRSERSIEDALREAVAGGLVSRTGARSGKSKLFVATRLGLHAAGFHEMPVCSVSPRAERHLRALASTAVWLECTLGAHAEVLSERELRLGSRGQRPCGRPVASPYVHYAGGARKRPDLLIKPRSPVEGLPVAVEVELSRKSAARLYAICMAWKHCSEVDAVLYLAAPFLIEPLRVAIERAGAQQRIALLALAEHDVPATAF
jgi:hypothetical protein